MLWIDKYCPRRLGDLRCHPELTKVLQKLAEQRDIPHLLFYGPSGGGKTTRMLALLRDIFGEAIDKMKTENYTHKESNTEVLMCQSPHHMILPCPDLGTRDRVIVQEVIKELSSNVGAISFFNKSPSYRVFLFQDADALTEGAQAGLRRTLEKYVRNARVFLSVEHFSSIISPLRSRCLCIRVPLPTIEEIVTILRNICVQEALSVDDTFLKEIAYRSERNLRRAILILETAATQPKMNMFDKWALPWELYLHSIADIVVKKQTPQAIGECRDRLYDLLSCCIPGETLILKLAKQLCQHPRIDGAVKPFIFHAAAHFNHTMAMGSKEVWHLEAFIAQVMAQIKAIEMTGEPVSV